MRHHFFKTAFPPSVQAEQSKHGSRRGYARLAEIDDPDAALSAVEVAFIGERDSFYLGTVLETGWPYVQHRGGPPGFVRVLDDRTLAWADFAGNRQYVSIGSVAVDDRVALFFIDYPGRQRLKILGHMSAFEIAERADLKKPGWNRRATARRSSTPSW